MMFRPPVLCSSGRESLAHWESIHVTDAAQFVDDIEIYSRLPGSGCLEVN